MNAESFFYHACILQSAKTVRIRYINVPDVKAQKRERFILRGNKDIARKKT